MKHQLAHERLADLERLLADEGTVVVSRLAKRWKVSGMTIRRDLRHLAERGGVARVHGGAVANGALRFGTRLAKQRTEKMAAARKLVPFLPDKGCIYLDGSTTIYHLVEHLAKRPGLVVATNNLDTFMRIVAVPGLEPVLVGGSLNRATDNFVGPHARRCLDALAFDAAFFSAFALDSVVGPSEPSPEDSELKETVCGRSARIHLAINQHKLGRRAAGCWGFPADQAVLTTDLAPNDARLASYRDRFSLIR